jgi:hypothetical protein
VGSTRWFLGPNGAKAAFSGPGLASLEPNVGSADEPAPFLRFHGNELAEFGWGHRHRIPAEIAEATFDFVLREAGTDLAI